MEKNKRNESAAAEQSPWEHLVHYAHVAHLGAEMAEVGERMAHVVAAQKLLRTHAQMALDVARMHYHVLKVKAAVQLGGDAGYTAAWRLIRARGALGSARLAYENERPAAETARRLLMESSDLRFGRTAGITRKVGEALNKLEPALAKSLVGSKLLKTGKIITSKAFTHSLIAVGAACAAIETYHDSPAETTPGKIKNALLGGGAGALTMANPVVAAADLLLPKGYKPGELFRGTADALSSIDEAMFSPEPTGAMENFHRRSRDGVYGKAMQEASGFGDFFADAAPAISAVIRNYDNKPLDDMHKRSMQGAYGKVLRAASEAGEFWSERGLKGGFNDFTHSLRWWVSH